MGTFAEYHRPPSWSSVLVGERTATGVPVAMQPPVMTVPPTLSVVGPAGNSPVNGGVVPQIAFDDARVTHRGQVNVTFQQFGVNYLQNALNAGWTWPQCMDEFDHYGADLDLKFRAASNSEVYFWVWVDGQPATAAPVQYVANISAGSPSYFRILFAAPAQRRIQIYRYLADFGGLDIEATGAVSPVLGNLPKVLVLGDSYVEGIGANTPLGSLAVTVGRLLGLDTYTPGQGGTGYVTNVGAPRETYGGATRLSFVQQAAPDLLIIFGSQNDDGAPGVQAAAAATYAAVATLLPATRIIVVGPPSLGSPPTADRLANRDAVQAAADAAPNVVAFIDPLEDEQGDTWVDGTGNAVTPNGTGNADVFAAGGPLSGHPTQAGHNYYARRIAQEISTALSA